MTGKKTLNFQISQELDNRVQALAAAEAEELQELRAELLKVGVEEYVSQLPQKDKDLYEMQLDQLVSK